MLDLTIDASVAVEWCSPNYERPDLNSFALPLRQAALEWRQLLQTKLSEDWQLAVTQTAEKD